MVPTLSSSSYRESDTKTVLEVCSSGQKEQGIPLVSIIYSENSHVKSRDM